MGVKKYFEKKKWERKLENSRKRRDMHIENSADFARSELAHAYADEATALVNLGRLTGDEEYLRDAVETWDYAAKAADESITDKGNVAKMYREYGESARERLKGEGGKGEKGDDSWYAKKEDIDPNTKKYSTGAIIRGKKGPSKGLEGTLAIIGVGLSIFFFSPSITGNVIGNLTNSTSNVFGMIFLIVGLIAGFFLVRDKKPGK